MKSWIAKNWWLFLIIPAIAYFCYKLFQVLYVYLTAKVGKPDLESDNNEFNSDMGKITSSEIKKIDEIEATSNKKKEEIDLGTTKPADVFNEELKDEKKISN